MKAASRIALDERRARMLDLRAAMADEKSATKYLKTLEPKDED